MNKQRKNLLWIIGVLMILSMLLAACPAAVPAGTTSGGDAAAMPEEAGPNIVRYNLSTEPPTADPALSTDTTSSAVMAGPSPSHGARRMRRTVMGRPEERASF